MQEHHKSHSLLRCRSLHCGLMQVLCDSRTFRHCRSSMRAVLCSIQLCARERTGSLLVTRLCHVESNCPFILSSHSSKEEILELIVDRTRSSKPANPLRCWLRFAANVCSSQVHLEASGFSCLHTKEIVRARWTVLGEALPDNDTIEHAARGDEDFAQGLTTRSCQRRRAGVPVAGHARGSTRHADQSISAHVTESTEGRRTKALREPQPASTG